MSKVIGATIRKLRAKVRATEQVKSDTLPYSVYLDHRKELFRLAIDNGRSLDKIVIFLSSGAIALSIAFLKDIVGEEPVKYSAALVTSWVFFVLALGCTLASIYLSMEAAYEEIDSLDIAFEREENCRPNRKAFLSKKLDLASIISVLLGLLSLFLFVFENV